MLPLFADIFQQGNRFVRGGVEVVTRLSTLVSTSGIGLLLLLLYKINQLSSHCEFICTASDASETRQYEFTGILLTPGTSPKGMEGEGRLILAKS